MKDYYESCSNCYYSIKFILSLFIIFIFISIILFEFNIGNINNDFSKKEKNEFRVLTYLFFILFITLFFIVQKKLCNIEAGINYFRIKKSKYNKKYKYNEIKSFNKIWPNLYRIKVKNEKYGFYFISYFCIGIGPFFIDFTGIDKFIKNKIKENN